MTAFPWCLASPSVSNGVSGAVGYFLQAPVTDSPFATGSADANINRTVTHQQFNIILTRVAGKFIDGIAAITVSGSDAVLSGTLYKSLDTNTSAVTITGTSGATYTASVPWSVNNADTWTSWITGSLAGSIETKVNNLAASSSLPAAGVIAGLSGMAKGPYDPALSVYSTLENGTGNAVRNTGVWSGGVNLTCVSSYSSIFGNAWQFTAISPIHVVSANHIAGPIPNGTTIWFCDNSGSRTSRTSTRSTQIGGSDILITTLNSPLTSSIIPATALPANWWTTYLPNPQFNIPVIFLSQDMYVGALGSLAPAIDPQGEAAQFAGTVHSSILQNFVILPRVGDSGCGEFFVISGSLTIISIAHYYGGPGQDISSFTSAINTEMALAGTNPYTSTTYALSPVNLASFPSGSPY